ncbi:MAG TPA: ABC transporter permease subunit [Gemmataceae bacterium]|nr:ABC transporter permease subunit [Gemmataceae bacterium]
MPDTPPAAPPGPAPQGAGIGHTIATLLRSGLALRREIPAWQTAAFALLSLAVTLGLWWFVTRDRGDGERIIQHYNLPSPAETFASFPSLWSERYLTVNTVVTLRRVVLGFGLAVVVGVPLGILCGCFPRVHAFFLPQTIFGRNIPIAALIPLSFGLFGIGELQKVMFIFIACVAFIVSDAAQAVAEVGTPYVDTAYTLGAGRWQVIMKVLVPLALPSVFNSLRVLFGLAFGYIMLAEVIKFGSEGGGLGDLIDLSQRQGPREHILLILILIPILAVLIDRALYWVQRELFPHRYGGAGVLKQAVGAVLHAWDDLKCWLRPAAVPAAPQPERKPS